MAAFNLTMNAIPLAQAWEGPFKPKAWLDKIPNPPVWTIGKGLTKLRTDDGHWRDVGPNDRIDEEENDFQTHHFFREEIEPILASTFDGKKLQPHQRDALSSIVYNVGVPKAKFPKTTALIQEGAPISSILDEWVDGEWNGALGLYRRRLMEAIVFGFGWPWENAYEATKRANWSTNWRELVGVEELDTEIFGEASEMEPITDPTPETELTTSDLNIMQAESLRTGRPISITPVTPKVPLENYEYLSDEQKAEPKVKDVRKSQRGRAVGKKAVSKGTGAAGVGGVVAVATGTAEPVLKVVDKYPKETLAYVAVALIVVAIVYHYWSEWQLQKGRDDADTLLG